MYRGYHGSVDEMSEHTTMDIIRPRRQSFIAHLWLGSGQATDWLFRRLDAALVGPQVHWYEPVPHRFRMSGAGEPCVRALCLAGLGHGQVFRSRTLRIFATGRAIEHEIVQEMQDAGVLVDTNKSCNIKSLPLVGHYDVLVADPATDEKLLGEIKSIKEERFEALPNPASEAENGPLLIVNGYRGYVVQWTMYAVAKGNLRGFLLFESKNTQRRLIYWMRPDLDLFEQVMALHRSAWKYVQMDQVAPMSREVTRDPLCKRCWRRYLCAGLPKEAVDYSTVRAIDATLAPVTSGH